MESFPILVTVEPGRLLDPIRDLDPNQEQRIPLRGGSHQYRTTISGRNLMAFRSYMPCFPLLVWKADDQSNRNQKYLSTHIWNRRAFSDLGFSARTIPACSALLDQIWPQKFQENSTM